MNDFKVVKLGLTVSALALLAACTAPGQTITVTDAAGAYRIDCDGDVGGLNYCFERAGKSCGAVGYTIVGVDGVVLADSDVANESMAAVTKLYQSDKKSVLVRCGS